MIKITAIFQKASGQPEVTIILRDNNRDVFDEKEGKELGELLYKSLPSLTLDEMMETIRLEIEKHE